MLTTVEHFIRMHNQDATDLTVKIMLGNKLIYSREGIKTWQELKRILRRGVAANKYNYATLSWSYPDDTVLSLSAFEEVMTWRGSGLLYIAVGTLQLMIADEPQRHDRVDRISVEGQKLHHPSGLAAICQGLPSLNVSAHHFS